MLIGIKYNCVLEALRKGRQGRGDAYFVFQISTNINNESSSHRRLISVDWAAHPLTSLAHKDRISCRVDGQQRQRWNVILTLATVNNWWDDGNVINIRGGRVIMTSNMIEKMEMEEAGEIKQYLSRYKTYWVPTCGIKVGRIPWNTTFDCIVEVIVFHGTGTPGPWWNFTEFHGTNLCSVMEFHKISQA